MKPPTTHILIPDTQAKPGVQLAHHGWIGQYIADKYVGKPLTVIGGGDHADMPSLSSYDKGTGRMEGRRYVRDIDAHNEAWALLDAPIAKAEREQRRRSTFVAPRKVKLRGNHEYRITRAANQNVQLEGIVTLDDLDDKGWEVHDFLEVVTIDGVAYSHYFANPMTGRPFGGQSIDARLKTIGFSFSMFHQQGLKTGIRDLTNGERHRGLIAGSCYLHDEEYLGPQGNSCWQGIIVCHQVRKGDYDLMEVSLDYLCRRYEGVSLNSFKHRKYRN